MAKFDLRRILFSTLLFLVFSLCLFSAISAVFYYDAPQRFYVNLSTENIPQNVSKAFFHLRLNESIINFTLCNGTNAFNFTLANSTGEYGGNAVLNWTAGYYNATASRTDWFFKAVGLSNLSNSIYVYCNQSWSNSENRYGTFYDINRTATWDDYNASYAGNSSKDATGNFFWEVVGYSPKFSTTYGYGFGNYGNASQSNAPQDYLYSNVTISDASCKTIGCIFLVSANALASMSNAANYDNRIWSEASNQWIGMTTKATAGTVWGCYIYASGDETVAGTTISNINDSVWRNYACLYKNNTVGASVYFNTTFFVNGGINATVNQTSIYSGSFNLGIGRVWGSYGYAWRGSIDDAFLIDPINPAYMNASWVAAYYFASNITTWGNESSAVATSAPYVVNILTPANDTWVAQRYLNITAICNSSSTPFINATLQYTIGQTAVNASTVTNGTQFYFNQSVPADGYYFYNVSCYTSNSVSNTSDMGLIKVDTTAPNVSINAPANGSTYYSNASMTFNTTAYDSGSNLSNAVYNWSFWSGVHTPNWVGQPTNGGYFNTTNTSTLTAGSYCVNITVNDSVGNANLSYICFTLLASTSQPYAVNILTPVNSTNIYQKYLNVTGICKDNGNSFVNVTLNYNGTLVANASGVSNNTAFYFNQSVATEGQYYYNLTCYLNNSLSNTSENRIINITRNVTQCGVLGETNWYYYMSGNIAGASGTSCISAPVDNITLECNSKWINNTGNSNYGIYVSGSSDKIYNCRIGNFTSYNLYVAGSSGEYTNTTIYGLPSSGIGIAVIGGSSNLFKNSSIATNAGTGIYLDTATENNFSNTSIEASNGGSGIEDIEINIAPNHQNFVDTFINSSNRGLDIFWLGNAAAKKCLNLTNANFSASQNVYDIYLEILVGPLGDSFISLTNTTYNKSAIYLSVVDYSEIQTYWYADVHIVDSVGADIANANVNFSATNAAENINLTTNATGWIPQQNITEFVVNRSGTFNYTPHNIVASKNGYSNNLTQNNNVTQNSIFTIILSVGPYAINILAPANNTWANQQYLNITGICNSTTTPLINVTLNYNTSSVANSSTVTNGTAFYFNQSVASDGFYYYNLTCYEASSSSNTSETRLLKIDSVPPTVIINQPTNGSNINSSLGLTINVTSSNGGSGLDEAVTNDSAWAGVFSPSGNYFNLTNTSTVSIGSHCVNVTINDTVGNSNYSYVCFTTFGSIYGPYGIAILTPPNNTIVAQRYLNITGICNSSTIPLVNASLDYNGSTQLNGSDILNATPFYFNQSVIADGWYWLNISCSSTNPIPATSSSIYVKVDTTSPSISINAPTNGSNVNASLGLTINITATDATTDLDKAVTNDSSWVGIFSPTGNYFNITNTSDVVDGSHCVDVIINDTAGNANSAYVCFTTYGSYYPPYGVGIITPSNNTWVTQKYLNITGICNSSTLPLINASLNYNGTVQLNTSNILNATPFYFNVSVPADGWYYYYISCYSASVVEGTSSAQYLKVDSTPPSITINQPINGSIYLNNETLTINVTATDSGIGIDKAITNSTYWAGTFSPIGNYFNISNTSTLLGATYCVQVTVNDSLNLQNSAYSCFTEIDINHVGLGFLPPTPNATIISSQPWAFINISYTNTTTLHSIILNWNGTNETNTMTCNYGEQYCYINKTSLPWGNYSFYVYLNVTVGAYNQTETTWVYIDECGNVNTNRTLHADINATGNCMIITAPNVTLNCNGYNLLGIGSGYGIYSAQANTAIRNCEISNFYSAITLNNTGGTAEATNNTLTDNWLGLELNSSSNGIFRSNSFAGNNGADIVSTNSINNILPNYFGGTLAAFDYYSDDISFRTVPALPALNSYSNGSSYFQINTTNASAWVLMNISYVSGMTSSSVGLFKYNASVWTGQSAMHYTNATPQYFLLNTSSFGTYVVLGCPPAKPFYYGGECYAFMVISVATNPQYYKIGDVVTIFATLSDPTAVASQVILYYANLGGTGYLQQSFTYDPINAQWVGAFKLRQHSEYLQVMALNATGDVIGYGDFYLTENKSPTWWDYFLWLLLVSVILVVIFFVGKWIYEAAM